MGSINCSLKVIWLTALLFTQGADAQVRLLENSGPNYVGFSAPAAVSSNILWTLPAVDGSANQVLSTNGSGILTWQTAGGDLKSDGTIGMSGTFKVVDGTAAGPGITFASDTDTGIYRAGANIFAISTTGAERLRIDSSGRVGIGGAPAERLDIGGGNIKMGWERVTNTCNNNSNCTVNCTAGKNVLSCGCSGSDEIKYYFPNTDTSCRCDMFDTGTYTVYAICANMK